MDHRDYKALAKDAAKLTTKFLKELGIEQKEIAQRMGISFSYFEMMLRGAKPVLPQHAIKLQDVTLGEIADRNGVLTRLQVVMLLEATEAWVDIVIAWKRDGDRDDSDTGVIALFQERERRLTKLVGEGLDRAIMFQKVNDRFPEKQGRKKGGDEQETGTANRHEHGIDPQECLTACREESAPEQVA